MEMALISLAMIMILIIVGLTYLTFHLWIAKASTKYFVPKGYLRELPTVAFHVPVKNEPPHLLERLLSSISSLKYPRERMKVVVICDDEDPRPMEEVCKKAQKDLEVVFIHREKARGFKAGALNEALKIESDVIVVLDVDSIVPQDFLIKALPSLYEASDVAAVSTRWEPINVRESLLSEAYSFGQNFFTRGLFRGFQAKFRSFMILGSGCLVKRNVIMEVGGWDEKCVAEDLELSIRLRLRGYRIVYNDLAHVWLECPSRYSDLKNQQRRWACGISQLLLKHFRSILNAKLKVSERLSLLTYLTQYWGLALVGLSIVLLPLLALLDGDPPLLSLLPISVIGITALSVYGYKIMKYKLDVHDSARDIMILGRAAALTIAMSFDTFIYSLRPLMKMKCSWRVTPKGPSKKTSKNVPKLELALIILLLVTLMLSTIKSFPVLTVWSATYLAALIYVVIRRFQ